ncbi:MAG: flavocytochrome c, partial [Erysipelotrichaceae bacterium]
MKKLFSLLLSALMILTLTACSSGFKGGTYEGSAKGFSSDIKLQVTISDDKVITGIARESADTSNIGEAAMDLLTDKVLTNNSVDLDAVAGASISSNGFIEALNAALKAAGLSAADLKAVEGTETGDVELDADVVVVGAGGAGMTAAIKAAKEGKSVIILEKGAVTGGNTSRSTGGMNAAKTELQDTNEFGEDAGVEKTLKAAEAYPDLIELAGTVKASYDEYKANPEGYFDSVELFALDTLIGGKDLNDKDLVWTMCANSAAAIDWLAGLDTPIMLTNVGAFGGASVKRIHRPVNEEGKTLSVGAYLVPLLEENCDKLGIDIITETKAEKILTDENGAAVGVEATGANGKVTVNAKAVVIASGGFGGNLEMVAQLKPELDGFITTNTSTCTGDGIVMAQELGADTVDMDQIQIHPTVLQSNGALITEGLRGDGAILVNQEGVRFADEVGTRDAVSAAELAQTGGYAYLIVDQKMIDASTVIQGYIKKGYTAGGDAETLKGTDLETLAGLIEVDAATLTETVDKWNACVEAKTDAEFGRTSFANKLEDAYIAIKIAPGIHHTMGGLKINTSAEVINTEGNVIPGLFAAGEVTGGVHGANRLGGNAVCD